MTSNGTCIPALLHAVVRGDLGEVDALLSRGADVEARAPADLPSPVRDTSLDWDRWFDLTYGATPLMLAADIGNAALIRRLLNYGANINAEDRLRRSAIR